jgi:hypothetical protein
MSTHSTAPDDDDALADALADAWIEQAAGNPIIRRAALRAAGLLREADTQSELARQCGISETTLTEMVRMFRAKVAAAALRDPAIPRRIRKAASDYLSTKF